MIETINFAYNWITSVAKNGSFSEANTHQNQYDLYSGSCGVLIYTLEYYQFTNLKEVLTFSEEIADSILENYKEQMESKFDISFFHKGLSGLAFCLYEVYQFIPKMEYLQMFNDLNDKIIETYKKEGMKNNSLRWGSAGVGLYLLWLLQELKEREREGKMMIKNSKEEIEESLRAGAKVLLDNAIKKSENELKWFYEGRKGYELPNYADGTAGISYYFLQLHEVLGDEEYLNISIKGANYLLSIANLSSDGCLIYHSDMLVDDAKYYLGECNGNTGTAKFWMKMFAVTQDEKWKKMAIRSGKNLLDYYPATNWWIAKKWVRDYYWNTMSLCDGSVGVTETMILLSHVNPNGSYENAIDYIINNILSRRDFVVDDEVCWIQAEDRVTPDKTWKQVGLYQGAGGITMTFMHLLNPNVRIKLPDYLF